MIRLSKRSLLKLSWIAVVAPLSWGLSVSMSVAQDYVGSDVCTECHEDEAHAWSKSHHALAWTQIQDGTIRADFDGTSFTHDGMSVVFSEQAGQPAARVTEKDGSVSDYQIHSVIGIEPLQQYLIETDPGRLQSFDVVWDTEKSRWFHLYPDQGLPPDDGLHWTGPYKNWNARCAECHATGYDKSYDAETKTYASAQSEIGVGCEGCHGPGSQHLEWVSGKSLSDGLTEFGFVMDWTKTENAIQQCAGCHSRREALQDGNPVPGTPFHDAYNLATLRPGLYHSDGQIQDEVYVYGSFLQSRMYQRGVGCMDCHVPHTADVRADGNGLCTQCHSPAGNPDFPTLTLKNYDASAHHHHVPGGEGAQCINCHMIERVYMGVDGRRDHSFRIPRPDLGLGTDACTDCHIEEGQGWAAAQIEEWFPASRNRSPHFGTVFEAAQTGRIDSPDTLLDIAKDAGQAGIVRATALYLLQPYASDDTAFETAPLLSDSDPLVRANAIPLQQNAQIRQQITRLEPLLSDPLRNVRLSAAKAFLTIPSSQLSQLQRARVQEGLLDWQRSLAHRLDFPETHLVLGGLALTLRNAPAAQKAFREVVSLDPQRAEAWPMLIQLAHINQGPQAALRKLEEALTILPDDPALGDLARQFGR